MFVTINGSDDSDHLYASPGAHAQMFSPHGAYWPRSAPNVARGGEIPPSGPSPYGSEDLIFVRFSGLDTRVNVLYFQKSQFRYNLDPFIVSNRWTRIPDAGSLPIAVLPT